MPPGAVVSTWAICWVLFSSPSVSVWGWGVAPNTDFHSRSSPPPPPCNPPPSLCPKSIGNTRLGRGQNFFPSGHTGTGVGVGGADRHFVTPTPPKWGDRPEIRGEGDYKGGGAGGRAVNPGSSKIHSGLGRAWPCTSAHQRRLALRLDRPKHVWGLPCSPEGVHSNRFSCAVPLLSCGPPPRVCASASALEVLEGCWRRNVCAHADARGGGG